MAGSAERRIAIGIAGWSYPDWRGVVYPLRCRDELRFCAGFVHCIEINSTFYRIPQARSTAAWVERTADQDLFFTAKLPQVLTHELRLDPADIAQTRAGLLPLRDSGRLRMLLSQHSARFSAAPAHRAHLTELVLAFRDLAPLAVEVRHRSWQEAAALDFVRGLAVSLVHLDYPGSVKGFGLRTTGVLGPHGIAYFRLHGRNAGAWFRKDAGRDEVYDWDYRPNEVEELVARTREIAASAPQTIVIANNHFQGQGMKVALELIAALEQRRVRVPDPLLSAFPSLRRIAAGGQRGLFE